MFKTNHPYFGSDENQIFDSWQSICEAADEIAMLRAIDEASEQLSARALEIYKEMMNTAKEYESKTLFKVLEATTPRT
jgi:hypothetical protein